MGGTFAAPEKGREIVNKTYELTRGVCYLRFYSDIREWHIYSSPLTVVPISGHFNDRQLRGNISLRVLPEIFVRSSIDVGVTYRIGCTITCGDEVYPNVIATVTPSSSSNYFRINEPRRLLEPHPSLLQEIHQ